MKSRAVAPGDWAGAEEWVSNRTVSGITPRCRTRPKGDKMRWCVKREGAEFQRGPGQAPLSPYLRGEDPAINSPAKVQRVGGKRSFDCFMPGSSAFTRWSVENKTGINNSSDMHICMDDDEVEGEIEQ